MGCLDCRGKEAAIADRDGSSYQMICTGLTETNVYSGSTTTKKYNLALDLIKCLLTTLIRSCAKVVGEMPTVTSAPNRGSRVIGRTKLPTSSELGLDLSAKDETLNCQSPRYCRSSRCPKTVFKVPLRYLVEVEPL